MNNEKLLKEREKVLKFFKERFGSIDELEFTLNEARRFNFYVDCYLEDRLKENNLDVEFIYDDKYSSKEYKIEDKLSVFILWDDEDNIYIRVPKKKHILEGYVDISELFEDEEDEEE